MTPTPNPNLTISDYQRGTMTAHLKIIENIDSTRIFDFPAHMNVPVPKHTPKRKVFSPKHVAQLRNDMVEFMKTPYGEVLIEDAIGGRYQQRAQIHNNDDVTEQDAHGAYQEIMQFRDAEIQAETLFWNDPELMLIHVDEPFVDMLYAAAMSASDDKLQPDELLAPKGLLVLDVARPIPELQITNPANTAQVDAPIRAISWHSIPANVLSLQPVFEVTAYFDGWHERENNHKLALGGQPILTEHIHAHVVHYARYRSIGGNLPRYSGEAFLIGLVRSIGAITRSAHTSETTKNIESRIKVGGRARSITHSEIRVLSLINRNYGRYELDAATSTNKRAPMVTHWVRGHWRKQWYPSLQDNRTIWIDGFVRGTHQPTESSPPQPQTQPTVRTAHLRGAAPHTDRTGTHE